MNTNGTTRKVILLSPVLIQKVKEMGAHYSESDSTIIRRAINELYEGAYRKGVYGYMAGTATAKNRLTKDAKKQEREALLKSLNDMTDEQLLFFLIDVGYIAQDELDEQCDKVKHFFVRDRALMWRYINHGVEEFENPYEEFDEYVAQLIKQKLV